MPHAEGRGSGPQGRINRLRKIVTALFRYERIEGKWYYLDEARGYAELVSLLPKYVCMCSEDVNPCIFLWAVAASKERGWAKAPISNCPS